MKDSCFINYHNGTWYLPKRCVAGRTSYRWYYFDADTFEIFWCRSERLFDPDSNVFFIGLVAPNFARSAALELERLEDFLASTLWDNVRFVRPKLYRRFARRCALAMEKSEASPRGYFLVKPAVGKE